MMAHHPHNKEEMMMVLLLLSNSKDQNKINSTNTYIKTRVMFRKRIRMHRNSWSKTIKEDLIRFHLAHHHKSQYREKKCISQLHLLSRNHNLENNKRLKIR